MSKMPNKDDLPALANWLDSHAMELVEAIINKHTASILEVLREQVKENRHLRDLLVDRERRAQPAPVDEEVRRDAERYRLMRKGSIDDLAVVRGLGAMDYGMSGVAYTYSEEIDGDDLDAAIDAAIAQRGEGGR